MKNGPSDLAMLIDELAKERGIARRQIGIQAGLSESTVKHIFNGNSKSPKIDTVAAIASMLGLPFHIFIGNHALRAGQDVEVASDKPETSQIVPLRNSSAQIVQSAEEGRWLQAWRDMNEAQRRRAVALLRAMIDADAA